MNVLVTGGAGFIGSHLVKALVNENHIVYVVDDYSSGKKKDNHHQDVIYIENHTKNLKNDFFKIKFDLIFHLGEYSRITPSFSEREKVWDSNILGTLKILELALHHNAKLIYAGSSTKFANEGINHSPYSFTKAQNSELILNYSNWFNLKYTICYFYNVFGNGYDSSPLFGYESVVSIFEKQWRNNLPLTICGDGKQKRAFTFIDDVVRGLLLAAKYNTNESFQLANKNSYSILEIAEMFSNSIEFIAERLGDRKESISTEDKAFQLLNWQTTKNVDQWIKEIKDESF